MPIKIRQCFSGAACVGAGLLTVSPVLRGGEPLELHGSISLTAAWSDRYSFLGDTARRGDLSITEVVLNDSRVLANGLKVSAQLYAYELAGYRAVALDFATVGYEFDERLGVRVGRNKNTFGLSGDAQDIDSVRPFAFLPLDIYGKTFRPLAAATDGIVLHGHEELGRAGAIDWQVNCGFVPPIDVQTPFMAAQNELGISRSEEVKGGRTFLASLAWRTPVKGLRAAISVNRTRGVRLQERLRTAAEIFIAPSDVRLAPLAFTATGWDGLLAGQFATGETAFSRETYSLEYTAGVWLFAAEYFHFPFDTTVGYPAPLGGLRSNPDSDGYYLMMTREIGARCQAGVYYAESFVDRGDRRGVAVQSVPRHTAFLKDLAVAVCYSPVEWWQVKVELHALNGTKGVTAAGNADASTWRPRWSYFVLKSTVSF